MLTLTEEPDLAAVRALADEVVAHDGGRLKLELDHVASNPVDTALWYDEGRLLGYAGYYRFGGSEPEIAGMVAPDARCRGIGTHLLTPLLAQAHEQGCPTALLVVPAGTEAGAAFAAAHGAGHAFSEHHLVLGETPTTAEDAATVLRPAAPGDLPVLERVVAAAFEEELRPIELDRFGDSTYAIEHAGALVGHIRLSVAEGRGGIYGFAVDPSAQGRGIGRDVLARAARLLRSGGCDTVTLEVETENASALHLYTSTGFVRDAGEDYWRLAT